MKWIKKKTRTLYSRTLWGMLSISLLVLVTVAATLFIWFRAQMVSGYHDLTKTAMKNTDVVFSIRMDNAKDMLREWYVSADGVGLRLEKDSDFVKHMAFLNKMKSVLNSTSYLQSVCFINKQREMVLNVGTGISSPENLEDKLINRLYEIDGRNRAFVWNVSNRKASEDKISFLSIPIAETSFCDEKFNGMIVMNIDLMELNKTLFANEQKKQFRIFILNESGIVVGNSGLENLGEDWSDKKWVKNVLAGEEQFQMKENGKRWDYLSFSANVEGYYIVAQSDYVTQIMNINSVFYIITAVITVAAVIIVMLMLLVTRRIFEPFTKIVMNLKQTEIAESLETEADDVTFLEHFYEDVSTHIEVLNEKKEKDFIVKNLLLGNQQEEIMQLLLNKKVITKAAPFYMVLILVENHDTEKNFSMQEYDMLRNMVSNMFNSVLGECGKSTYFEIGLRRMLFVVSATEETSDNMLLEKVKKAEKMICKMSRIKLYGVVSKEKTDGGERFVSDFGYLSECLKARHLLECEDTMVLEAEEVEPSEELVQKMSECLKVRDKAGYMQATETLLNECERLSYRRLLGRLEHVAEVICKTGKITRNNEIERDGKRALQKQVASLSGRDEIVLWMEALYDEAAMQISKVSNHSTANMIEEAVDYIRNNYDDCNLNVNMLADKLNISAAYFGKQFTEFTGCKALEYILKVRMEKARGMLISEPTKDIAQIAEAVGYNNSTYFTTAFRKYYGVTPSRFRDYNIVMEKEMHKG